MSEKLALWGGKQSITLDQEEALLWPRLTSEDEEAVLRLLRKGEISVSEEPRLLEKELGSRYLGARFALATGNGTAALQAALFAAGLKPGNEVIVPSYTYWASVMPAAAMGAGVVFCEIDPATLTLDPADFRRKITPRTRVVIPVHLWGLPCAMDEILRAAREHGIIVIEDACHAHGAEYRGRKAGTIGDIGFFSFQASKNLPGGEGGMMVTGNEAYYNRAVALGHYRRTAELPEPYCRYRHTSFGFKHRMSPLHAAIARTQLKSLDQNNARRNANIEKLRSALRTIPGFSIPETPGHIRRVYYENNVIYRSGETGVPKERVVEALIAEGARVRGERYPLLHMQPYFVERGSDPDALPITRGTVEEIVSFPTFPWDDGRLVDQYIDALRKVAGQLLVPARAGAASR